MSEFHTIIIGSGLSGLSAGVELINRGKKVLILESREVLGGRTSSWDDDGMEVESGLHRYLGFYRHFPELIHKAKLKLNDMIVWEDEVEMRMPEDLNAVYGASVYRPLQTLLSFMGNNHYLSIKDKISLIPFLASGVFNYYSNPKKLDEKNVYEVAKSTGVTENAIEKILIPLTTGIFFLPPENYSAYALFGLATMPLPFKIFGTRIGAFNGGMTEVLANPLAEYIKSKGGEVKTNAKVDNIIIQNKAVIGLEVEKEKIFSENIILATSLHPAQKIITNSVLISDLKFFHDFLTLPSMPVVTFQAELNSPSMSVDHTTFAPTTEIACFSEQSRTTFRNTKGRISAIFASPEKYIYKSEEELNKIFIDEMSKININLNDKITKYRVNRLYTDFYSLAPGNMHLRPECKTNIKGLYFAGDYTKQRYLGTMEGAVYSGKIAARYAVGQNL